MNIDLLISKLSNCNSGLSGVNERYCENNSIVSTPKKPGFYVEPELDAPDELAPVLLISAPAAVGKTTLAHHIHSKLNDAGQSVLYIPLQEANIGHDFFAGRLAGVFPDLTKRQILDAVFSGKVVLLFDGYDEVTMRSDQIDRNKEFINEIKEELDEFQRINGKASPCIVFLFRSVFADFGVFDGIKESASEISVLFFDVNKRKEFLSQYLDFKSSSDARGASSKSHLAGDFIDIFQNSFLSANDGSSVFFGHAIVLSAFGDFLHDHEEVNASKLLGELSGDGAVENNSVRLLTKIIKLILDREEGKFPISDYSRHIPYFNPYSVEVQESLLFGIAKDEFFKRLKKPSSHLSAAIDDVVLRLKKHPQYEGLNVEIRNEIISDYRRELELRIAHHPFIDVTSLKNSYEGGYLKHLIFRNPVYREYYLAKVIACEPKGSWSLNEVRNDYSYYLAFFFLGLVEGRNMSTHQEFLFSLISLFATASYGNDFQFKMAWDSEKELWVNEITTLNIEVEPFFISDPLLVISVPPGGVLRNVLLFGDNSCEFEISGPGPGGRLSEKILISDCLFVASSISVASSAVKFDKCDIVCKELQFNDVVESIEGLETLVIRKFNSDHVNFKFSEYVCNRWGSQLESAKEFGSESGESLFRKKMEKILLRFRRHHRAEYGCHDKKFNNHILSDHHDKAASELSDFLFNNKFLYSEPGLILMNQDKFSDYDIFYKKQNQITFEMKSSDLYRELISSPYGSCFIN